MVREEAYGKDEDKRHDGNSNLLACLDLRTNVMKQSNIVLFGVV